MVVTNKTVKVKYIIVYRLLFIVHFVPVMGNQHTGRRGGTHQGTSQEI